MEFRDEIESLIRQVMPSNADISIGSSSFDFDVHVSWMLNDDCERPHKTSKTISIYFSHAAIDDYECASELRRADADRRIKTFFYWKLKNFDPNHNTPSYEKPPVEQWYIDSYQIFG